MLVILWIDANTDGYGTVYKLILQCILHSIINMTAQLNLPHLTMSWEGVHSVIVAFPGQTHLHLTVQYHNK